LVMLPLLWMAGLLTDQAELLPRLIAIFSSLMVLTAMGIVAVSDIPDMIRLYQVQSIVLVGLTVLTVLNGELDLFTQGLLLVFALFIPGMLAFAIWAWLAQATVPGSRRGMAALLKAFLGWFDAESRAVVHDAMPIWLERDLSTAWQIVSVSAGVALTAIAFSAAFTLFGPITGSGGLSLGAGPDTARTLGVAVAMTLVMLGIFTMISRQDLISQIIGLLVMDHGLFLAVIRVIGRSDLVQLFVICLFLYILITLVILVILLPELHHSSQTIEVKGQTKLKG
jgi:hydrogenase-4 membrane subunit HyfE